MHVHRSTHILFCLMSRPSQHREVIHPLRSDWLNIALLKPLLFFFVCVCATIESVLLCCCHKSFSPQEQLMREKYCPGFCSVHPLTDVSATWWSRRRNSGFTGNCKSSTLIMPKTILVRVLCKLTPVEYVHVYYFLNVWEINTVYSISHYNITQCNIWCLMSERSCDVDNMQ